MINLTEKFKHIYVLTLSSRPDRYEHIKGQLECMGIDINTINVHYATPFPHNNIIADAFNKTGKGKFTKPNEFDCARNHYGIIREAYDRGFEDVLIIEDDILFLNNPVEWNNALEKLPSDYDIIQFGGFTVSPNVKKYLTLKDVKYVEHPDVGLWNCSMYALSRKGMQFYIAFMNVMFWVADGPLYKAPMNTKLVKTYMTSIPMVIQADKAKITSDIRTAENDNIDYNNDNMYEANIKLTDYFQSCNF
ncbi:MAG: glucosyltransferase [Wendovervirus sonii]|uniref:Glucosyltransferase n=1 Tax=phage Lak_Megaphage_Sonny TaxID=3109229 RepID=A0ABZ0Z3E5_9CAUD|nr:MAG: glucosyltransferase [phage Lak_Megaphage_Sonny]